MEQLIEVSFPYSIADIESGPVIHYENHVLSLEFVDYTNTKRLVQFKDVMHYAYASIDADPRTLWDDRAYEIKNSAKIKGLLESNEIDSAESYNHYIICFNETGMFLELVFSHMVCE